MLTHMPKMMMLTRQEKVPVDSMVNVCDGLIEGLQQHAFITEQAQNKGASKTKPLLMSG